MGVASLRIIDVHIRAIPVNTDAAATLGFHKERGATGVEPHTAQRGA
jgi:hypothetical protein